MKVYTQDDIPEKESLKSKVSKIVFIHTEPNEFGVRHTTVATYSFIIKKWMIGTALMESVNYNFKWIYPPKELINE